MKGAHLLDLETGRQVGPAVEDGFTRCGVFAADGVRAAIGTDTGKIAIFAADGGDLTRFDAGDHSVMSLSLHPSRPVLASADAARRVRIWDLTRAALRPQILLGRRVSRSPRDMLGGRFCAAGDPLVLWGGWPGPGAGGPIQENHGAPPGRRDLRLSPSAASQALQRHNRA